MPSKGLGGLGLLNTTKRITLRIYDFRIKVSNIISGLNHFYIRVSLKIRTLRNVIKFMNSVSRKNPFWHRIISIAISHSVFVATTFMLLACADRSPNKNQNGRLVKKGVVYEGQQKLLSDFVNAFTRGDAEACAELYTDDTIYMQAGLPIEKGKNIVQNGYETYFKSRTNKVIKVSEPIEEVISFGNMAVIRGIGENIEETPQGIQITKHYKYMILSEKQKDGSWKMKWDIYNFDADYEKE